MQRFDFENMLPEMFINIISDLTFEELIHFSAVNKSIQALLANFLQQIYSQHFSHIEIDKSLNIYEQFKKNDINEYANLTIEEKALFWFVKNGNLEKIKVLITF